MIEKTILIITLILFIEISVVIFRSIIKKKSLIGRPPIPVLYFILAKILVVVNIIFLLLRGLNINIPRLFNTVVIIDIIALVFLIIGNIVLILTTIQLNNDLIFGLSSSESHQLQTKGIYSISRHPFYIGFLFILFSSCLFNPNILNIISFLGAWLIHHFIMIKEEDYLISQYGEKYLLYANRVNRYITL